MACVARWQRTKTYSATPMQQSRFYNLKSRYKGYLRNSYLLAVVAGCSVREGILYL